MIATMAPAAALTPHPAPAPAPQGGEAGAGALPRISIVTPSFNQGRFLRETMQSVLGQGYPNLEYVVIDGGSTDESVDVIREHEPHLAAWVSEKDAGQYDAINKGFARTSGVVMAWLNSDDKYTPWALPVVGEIFAQLPEVQWLTTLLPLHWDERGLPVRCKPVQHGYCRRSFLRGENLPRPGAGTLATSFIQQESTFWRRSLWEKAGGRIDSSLQLAGDFELWAKFFQHADLYGVSLPLGGFRMHGDQKTAHRMKAYVDEAMAVLARHGGRPYTKLEAFTRTRVKRVLPGRLKRALGLREPYKVCVNRGGRWGTATRY